MAGVDRGSMANHPTGLGISRSAAHLGTRRHGGGTWRPSPPDESRRVSDKQLDQLALAVLLVSTAVSIPWLTHNSRSWWNIWTPNWVPGQLSNIKLLHKSHTTLAVLLFCLPCQNRFCRQGS